MDLAVYPFQGSVRGDVAIAHVLNRGPFGIQSPLDDALDFPPAPVVRPPPPRRPQPRPPGLMRSGDRDLSGSSERAN